MPFERGTLAVTMFSLPESMPENYLELFSQYKAGNLDAVKDEPQVGWVGGRHLLETTIAERIANLNIFRTVLAAYFKVFVETLLSDKWGAEETKIRQWVDERETR